MGFKEHIAKKNTVTELREKLEKLSSNRPKDDEREWKLKAGADGQAAAVIRFLPGADGDKDPFVVLHTHFAEFPNGRYYVENCPTTIGLPCPMCDYNSTFYEKGDEEGRKWVSAKAKRQCKYISNILVIKDPQNPTNEGRNFIFKYGERIKNKILAAAQEAVAANDLLKDDDDVEPPVPPFDAYNMLEGANFLLVVERSADASGKYGSTYEKSQFKKPKPLFGGDMEKLEELYNKLYKLSDFVDPSQFKPYETLQNKLNEILGGKQKLRREEKTEKKYENVQVALEDDEIPDFSKSPMLDDSDDNLIPPETETPTDDDDIIANLLVSD